MSVVSGKCWKPTPLIRNRRLTPTLVNLSGVGYRGIWCFKRCKNLVIPASTVNKVSVCLYFTFSQGQNNIQSYFAYDRNNTPVLANVTENLTFVTYNFLD